MLNRFNWKSKRENYNRMRMQQHMEAQAANNKWTDADQKITFFLLEQRKQNYYKLMATTVWLQDCGDQVSP
jgi:hypothetical protein